MKTNQILYFLLFAYIVSIGFIEIFQLPIVGAKFQPPEIIFLVALVFWVKQMGRNLLKVAFKPGKLSAAILVYLTAITLATAFAVEPKPWLELTGSIYLLFVFIVFSSTLPTFENLCKFILNSFLVCGIIAALAGISGWMLTRFGVDTPLAWSAQTYYPYLGKIGRAQGFTTTPNMLMSLLGVCILLHFSKTLLHSSANMSRG